MTEPTSSLIDIMTTGGHILNLIANTDKKGKDKQTYELLTGRLNLLETYWKDVRENHGAVCRENAAIKATHEYFTKNLYYEYEDQYLEAKATLATRLSALARPVDAGTNSTNQPIVQLLPQGNSLPNLQIPKFSGVQRDWESWKELFCSLVTDVPTMPNIQKSQRLLSAVEGKAKARLAGMTPSSTNFLVAWNILLNTYDNVRVKLADHLNRLLSMTKAKKCSDDILTLLDTVEEAKRSMTALERPVEHWDDWLIHLVEVRLDKDTKQDWEKSIEGNEGFPTYASLKSFLECRCRTLSTSESMDFESNKVPQKTSSQDKHAGNKKANKNQVYNAQVASGADDKVQKAKSPCSMCKGNHFLSYCPVFINSGVDKRWSFVEKTGLCPNCLRPKHETGVCPSNQRCRINNCNELHYTWLHRDKTKSMAAQSSPTASNSYFSSTYHSSSPTVSVTLLATAKVIVETRAGETLLIRALLDPGSEVSFISERVTQSLRLAKKKSCTRVTGVGGKAGVRSVGEVDLTLRPTTKNDFKLHFTALVLPKVTSVLPGQAVEKCDWTHLQGLELADPRFNVPGGVDCLLGADVYPLLLLDGVKKGGVNEPVAQRTVLGWVLTGPAGMASIRHVRRVHIVRCHHAETSCCKLRDDLRKFWEMEEVPVKPAISAKDKECEEHFVRTHTRDSTGRYVLRLPFSQTPNFPGSLGIAKARLLGTERRHHKHEKERQAYCKFLQEYEALQHLERVPPEKINSDSTYYIPHHAVFKDGKIRVVFNASQPTSNGKSLNGVLHIGPKLQIDIWTVITNWRLFKYVFSADIVKMFRQFRIHPDDTDWLRIIWRESPEHPIQHFRLTTVTYGTACAPYQAIRTLRQLAKDEKDRFPLGAAILEKGTYVDDAFAGADTLEDALLVRQQLVDILRSAGMELDKWSSNHVALLSTLSDITTQDRLLSEQDIVSTLGLRWKPALDSFCFVLQSLANVPSTKRGLLSVVARLFDPVGWLSPILIRAKIIIQLLWIQGCDWDQKLDDALLAEWKAFLDQLDDIETINIPRFFGCSSSSLWFLHGFCDASERAYAAALYFVTADADNHWKSTLIIAKSKVAPIKTISIPRLELCGAALLTRLIAAVSPQFPQSPARTFCWSDSTVTLAWLRDLPCRWTTFVANKVSEIHTLSPEASWNHVCSEDNPADCASRGLSPSQLRDLSLSLWWNGPPWLRKDWTSWDPPVAVFKSDLERKAARPLVLHATCEPERPFDSHACQCKTFNHFTHVYAYILRWLDFPRTPLGERPGRGLKTTEICIATRLLVKLIQAEYFSAELSCLKKNKPLPHRSVIRRCSPFIDEHGLMRLGGRLQDFALPFEEKHPAIIPRDSHFATLIIKDAHLRTLHGGPQLVLSFIQRKFWIPQARNKVRRLVRLCVRCTRFHGRPEQQQMSPLPSLRGTPAPAFNTCGVDYAGPFPVRTTKGRGYKSTKGYVCLFICLVTRAIHLEIVSNLTTHTFLEAFSRFTGRRGIPSVVYSDNGTTFQGARSELSRLFDSASSFSKDVADAVANDGTDWRFIPPRAPHFGGLWEAGVKSFKHHLKRVLGDATLTFEEFSTLAVKIEACLNSRPLSPLSSNPEDLTPLTPGHFLIGTSLKAVPEPSDYPSNLSGVERYRLSTVIRNHFWRRWQKEVLHQHQVRSKWLSPNSTLKEGDLVLITDINLPATKWPLARVLTLHPGRDGLPRVATLKTATTTLDRPLVKLVRLPVETDFATAGGNDHVIAGGALDDPQLHLDGPISSDEDSSSED